MSSRHTRWRRHLGIVALLTVYLALASTYNFVTPLFEAPDEIWHYLYVRHLASGKGLPIQVETGSSLLDQQEAAQPPLYYALAALVTTSAPRGELSSIAVENPSGSVGDPTTDGNKNHFVHGLSQAFPWRGEVWTVHLARATSTALGALTVALTYLTGLELGLPLGVALAGAAAVALNPQFLFMSAAVDNDVAVAAAGALLLWCVVRQLRRPLSHRRSAMHGVVAGLALLAKPLALGGVGLVCLALGIAAWRARESIRSFVVHSVIATGVATAISGWWLIHNLLAYRTALPLDLFLARTDTLSHVSRLSEIVAGLAGLDESFWELFGWFNILAPPAHYVLYNALMALGGVGLASWGLRLWNPTGQLAPARRYCDWLGFAVVAAWSVLALAGLFLWLLIVTAFQGRLAFSGIAAYAIVLAVGWAGLAPRRFATAVSLALASVLAVPAVSAPWLVIQPAYARPRVLPPGAVAPRRPVNELIGPDVLLLGVDLDPALSSLHPGDVVDVTLYLEGTHPMNRDYTLFIQLLDWRSTPLVKVDSYPGRGAFPTSFWEPGTVIVDRYRLDVPNNVAVPSVGDLIVGMYWRPTMERLPVLDLDERPLGNAISLGPVVFRGDSVPTSDVHGVVFGDTMVLVGHSIERTSLAPGEMLQGDLEYATLAPVDRDYTIFVHLMGTSGLVAQDDGPPRGGAFPTRFWMPGERVTTPFAIAIPSSLRQGVYRLVTGWYDEKTGARLRTPEGDSVVLGDVQILDSRSQP